VFRHLADWFEEFRVYHRSDGKVVKPSVARLPLL
jgi:hypothetical protein